MIARSRGVGDDIIKAMDGYMNPAGIDPSEFSESRSMIMLGGLVAYSIVRNAGTGHDGRGNTIYNHTFIVPAEDLAAAGHDTRALDALYVQDKGARGILPTIDADLAEMPVPAVSGAVDPVLDEALGLLLEGRPVAIAGPDVGLQDILRMLPTSLRLVPFSTVAVRPKRQPAYKLIAMPDARAAASDGYAAVPGGYTPPSCVAYYARLIREGRLAEVDHIQRMFDAQGSDGPEGLALACDRHRHGRAPAAERPGIAERILRRAWGLGDGAFTECLADISSSLELKAPRGGWSRVSGAAMHRDGRDHDPWNIPQQALWMVSSLLDYNEWFDSRKNQLDGLARMSEARSRSAIRFTYGGHPRILLRFGLAGGILRGIQTGGMSDGPLPRAATFEVDRISDIRATEGYVGTDPVPDQAPPAAMDGVVIQSAP